MFDKVRFETSIYLKCKQNRWLLDMKNNDLCELVTQLNKLNIYGILIEISSKDSDENLNDLISLDDKLWAIGTLNLELCVDLSIGKVTKDFIDRVLKLARNSRHVNIKVEDSESLLFYKEFIAIFLNLKDVLQISIQVKNQDNFDWKVWFDFKKSIEFSEKLKSDIKLSEFFIKRDDRRWFAEDVKMLTFDIQEYDDFIEKTISCFIKNIRCSLALEYEINSFNECLNVIKKVSSIVLCYECKKSKLEYQDKLFLPMQPLTLNLSEEDYLTFEKDPVKYKLYQKAIHDALVDRVGDNKSIITTIMILGAGRGPLVNAAYYASIQAKCKINLIVVEKNPCPRKKLEKTLDALRSKGLDVTLIYEDMRNLQLEDDMKADIFVSELLGSFGDNELSPECLDEAEKVLKDDGISIPYTYSSYVQPITSWPSYQNYRSNPENFEQPWVLNTPNYYIIDDPKLLWSFHHPMKLRDEKYISNYRHETVSFKAKEDSVLHGFAGYFSTNLYKDIEFNIVPSTHTKDLISWWPMFFASKNVKFVGKGETIKIEFERKIIPNEKVWYQWKIDNDEPSNVEGKYNPFYLTSEIEELN